MLFMKSLAQEVAHLRHPVNAISRRNRHPDECRRS